MDWNFELTEQAALALYAKKYRQEKASGRLLRALGIICLLYTSRPSPAWTPPWPPCNKQ